MDQPETANGPLISLCVPTFNRAGYLTQMLEQISCQIKAGLPAAVEVVISDNASPDSTQEVIQQFIAEHPEVRVQSLRQERNVGADANIYNAFRHATGDFIYILSDDDLFLPGALATAIDILKSHPTLNAVTLNIRSFVDSPEEPRPQMLKLSADHLFTESDAALEFLGTFVTFLSVILFRRSLIADRDYANRIGTSLLQSYVFLDVLVNPGGLYVTQAPLIGIRDNNTGGYNFFEVFVTNFSQLLRHATQIGFSQAATRRVLKGHLKWLLGFVLGFKVHGTMGRLRPDFNDGRRRLLAAYGADPFLILVVLPAMYCPGRLARTIHRQFRGFRTLLKPPKSA